MLYKVICVQRYCYRYKAAVAMSVTVEGRVACGTSVSRPLLQSCYIAVGYDLVSGHVLATQQVKKIFMSSALKKIYSLMKVNFFPKCLKSVVKIFCETTGNPIKLETL